MHVRERDSIDLPRATAGAAQLRSRSAFSPWNRPQSTSTAFAPARR